MPLVPWPWLKAVPGFRWAGVTMSLTLQYPAGVRPADLVGVGVAHQELVE